MEDDITTFVGLDVHKESIAIAAAAPGREAPRFVGTVGAALAQLLKALGRLGEPGRTLVAYEAGGTGFALARRLAEHGWRCQVIAPSKMPRKPGDRIKTDRRDALTLAGYLRAGELTVVHVPDVRDEAMRDLSRAREDAVHARRKARQQIKAMLLRHGLRYEGKTAWGPAHERYLAAVTFEHDAQRIAWAEYRAAATAAHERVERLECALREQAAGWRFGPVVAALRCFKGIDFVAALTLVAEIGDLHRFAHPKQLMAYLGLVPSEHSSGASRAQGSITKTGNAHARRVLVESAWSYRYSARMSVELTRRNQDQPAAVREIAWRAQLRLCARMRRLRARGVHENKVCVAIARELVGFVWQAGRTVAPAH